LAASLKPCEQLPAAQFVGELLVKEAPEEVERVDSRMATAYQSPSQGPNTSSRIDTGKN